MATFEKNFSDLKNEIELIRIPGIQRDYAEGRQTTRIKEIRKSFLNELLKIVYSTSKDKLHLDFIYGYSKDGVFEPLDGQQRLTTLFLLYWFFSPQEDNYWSNNKEAFLSYATKQSTIDFCNELVKHKSNEIIEKFKERNENKDDKNKITLFQFIQKLGWFKWQWRYDSSISSMLVVIEEIYNLINDHYKERTADFTNLNNISFHLLSLDDEFDMGDELYIKMNARGKQLSSFDIMKSVLEEEIQLQGLAGKEEEQDWRNKIDGDWINYFWQKYSEGKDMQNIEYKDVETEVEMQLKRLIQRIICIQYYDRQYNNDQSYEKWMINSQDEFDEILSIYSNLAWNMRVVNSKNDFNEKLDFNQLIKDIDSLFYKENNRLKNAIELLDNIEWLPGKNIWEEYLKEPERPLLVAFFGIIAFLRIHPASELSQNEQYKKDFSDWVRFVRNSVLLRNTEQRIDKAKSQKNAVHALSKILDSYKDNDLTIRKILSELSNLSGLENAVLEEERIKSKCRLADSRWNELIDNLEANKYLWGQIIAVLKWSTTSTEEVDMERFKKYSEKLNLLFPLDSNQIDSNQFRASLLCLSNYGNWRNEEEYYLGETTFHRDRSFKSFLRSHNSKYGEVIKVLIDKWNTEEYKDCDNFEKLFKKLKQKEQCKIEDDWRKYIVLNPKILSFAVNSKLWFDKKGKKHVYLRQKIQSDTQHHEIFLAYLNNTINKDSQISVELHGWFSESGKPNTLLINTSNNCITIGLDEGGKYTYSLNDSQNNNLTSNEIINKLKNSNVYINE